MIPKPDPAGWTVPASSSATVADSAPLPRRLVLDTNVCLDLFVFRDPRWETLLGALRRAEVQAVTRSDCRTEWTLVLDYRRLQLDPSRQQQALAEYDALLAMRDPSLPEEAPDAALPQCRDRDDQKFLELAAGSGAEALITKDKALLKLARRMKKLSLFRILTPEQWVAEWTAATAGVQNAVQSTEPKAELVPAGATGVAATLQ